MDRQERYIERDDLKGATHLEITVHYTKGGHNLFGRGITPRGYYVSVRPVTKRGNMLSYELFAGRKRLLFETARFSAKQFNKAVEMAKGFEDELIAAVVAENKAAA